MKKAYFVLMIYNEEESLSSVIESIMRCNLPAQYERRILAVNDGSTDNSQAVLEQEAGKYPIHILHLEARQGMPLSFKAAFKYLEKFIEDDDLVFTLEADATNDIACVPAMVSEIEKGADVVIASRYAKGAASIGFPWYRLWGSSLINHTLSMMWNIPNVKDSSVLYRAYRGSILKKYIADDVPLKARKSFAVIAEILLHLSRYTDKFAEVPLRYDYSLKKGPSKMRLFRTLWEYTRITPRAPLRRQPIFWIAAGAFAVRIWGITYGFPDLVVLDEPALTRGALTMLKLHTLIPAFHPQDFATMYYPPVTAYIYLVVLAPVMLVAYLLSHAPSLSVYAQQLILDPTLPWVATRVTTAFIGALTVYLIGRLAEKIYPGSGIFAALFLATSFQHVTFSHIARHWAPSMLWIVALMWTGWHMLARASKRWYLLSGLLVGLAVGTGVLAGLLGIIPALTHFIRRGAFTQKLLSKNFWIFVATSVVLSAFFLALNPVVIHNLMPANQGSTIANSKSLLGLGILMVTEVRDFAQSETILFLFALLGIPYLLIRNRKFALVLVLSMLFAVASLYLFHYYILHYLTLELPLLTVLAGIGAYEIISMVPRNRGKLVLAIAIFLLPALIALRFSFLWTQPDTRHDARAYIEAHISPDARILSYTPNMKVVWPTAGSMKERLAFDPASSRLLDTTLLGLASSSYPAPSFNVFEIGTLSPDGVTKLTPGFLKSERFNYVVIDRSATKYPALEALIASGTIIAKFPSSGPAIDILANEISDFNFNPMALDVFEIKQLGPEVWIVQLPQ